MSKEIKMMNAEELIKKLEKIKSRYEKQTKGETIPYFKRIIEELQKISTIEDIKNTMVILNKLETHCRNNKEKYPNDKFKLIILLFTTTTSFLNCQKELKLEKLDFKEIHEYNLSNALTTKEYETVLSDSTNNLSGATPTIPLTKSYSLNNLSDTLIKEKILTKK